MITSPLWQQSLYSTDITSVLGHTSFLLPQSLVGVLVTVFLVAGTIFFINNWFSSLTPYGTSSFLPVGIVSNPIHLVFLPASILSIFLFKLHLACQTSAAKLLSGFITSDLFFSFSDWLPRSCMWLFSPVLLLTEGSLVVRVLSKTIWAVSTSGRKFLSNLLCHSALALSWGNYFLISGHKVKYTSLMTVMRLLDNCEVLLCVILLKFQSAPGF